MLKRCEECNKEFVGNGKARFCSGSCRVKFSRGEGGKNGPVPGVEEPFQPIPEKKVGNIIVGEIGLKKIHTPPLDDAWHYWLCNGCRGV